MRRAILAAVLALVSLAAVTDYAFARQRGRQAPVCDNSDVMRPCHGEFRQGQGRAVARHALKPAGRYLVTSAGRASGRASLRLGRAVSGLVGPLATKVAEIKGSCRAQLVSGVRHTLIAGTRTISLHASGRAADLAGDAPCIYRQLAGWPGGYSVDYARVRHVHISWDPDGGREWGLRFNHGGRHSKRHARRHHQRLARR